MERIEHIGIAVNSIENAGKVYEKLLNTPVYKTEEVKSENVTTAFLQCGPNKIELLEATSDDSPIAKFIAKKGEGVHHIAFEVTDIRAEMARLKSEGFVLLNEEPKLGADNKLVCFVHPKGVNGVLVELCESLKSYDVLDKYRIKFFKQLLFDKYFDSMDSVSEVLNQFLMDYMQPPLVNEFIIEYIDSVLNGSLLKETMVSESVVSVEISIDTSKFYQEKNYSDTDTPNFIIPTQDLKKIAEAWRDYLQRSQTK
ncbi:methylmalonyl-CoA epimerase [Mucilaginibacter sp. X5P1]|uniref:methylmalonyl-CoA epimerase n=1 Tax=Mucilaginibacter sp. X5P1 TaxID=2723088 RepID=UPI001609851F|nr:methylmalonyl-CoA epimerase [Mucilaginibacter sp. X5P1]MBB6141539.1 methylmalonyl-CoA epimerase [Mucilaginibacter sp. X5P1]